MVNAVGQLGAPRIERALPRPGCGITLQHTATRASGGPRANRHAGCTPYSLTERDREGTEKTSIIRHQGNANRNLHEPARHTH